MPKSISLFISFVLFAGTLSVAQTAKPLTTGGIAYTDSSLSQVLPYGTTIDIIGSGFRHIEGPVWVKDSGMLLFSDTKGQFIYRYTGLQGTSTFLEHTGYTGRLPYGKEPGSNGLAVTKNNELLVCEHGDRRLALYPLNAKYGLQTITDHYEGKRYNSPNDVIVKSDGTLYFTDPPYGLPNKQNDNTKQMKQNGVYLVNKEGTVKLLIDSLQYPNGIAFAPGEKYLYVSVSDSVNPHILRYEVSGNGMLSGATLFFDASSLPREDPMQRTDGLKVDTEGNVWASGPGGILVITPQGKLLGNIHTGEIIANCAWGDDGSSLYIMGNTFLYKVKTKAKGAGW